MFPLFFLNQLEWRMVFYVVNQCNLLHFAIMFRYFSNLFIIFSASFNPKLLHQVARAISDEFRAKFNDYKATNNGSSEVFK